MMKVIDTFCIYFYRVLNEWSPTSTACRQIFLLVNTNYFLFFLLQKFRIDQDTIDVQWWTFERERGSKKGINDINRLFWVSKRAPNRYEAPQQFTIYLLSCASYICSSICSSFLSLNRFSSTNFTQTHKISSIEDVKRNFNFLKW